jgi:hypothetical protein
MVLNASFNNISVIYIVALRFIVRGNRRKPLTCRKSHNVVSSTPRLSGVKTSNVSGDRH